MLTRVRRLEAGRWRVLSPFESEFGSLDAFSNTLFDWQRLWYECFSAMSKEALRISGIDPDVFYAECSELHQRHGTSEYAFVLSELPSLKAMYGENVTVAMQPAIDAFRAARRANLKLYPGVADALASLRSRGVTIAAFTESKAFYTNYRFRKLGLDDLVDFLYSPKDHDLPTATAHIRKYPSENYDLRQAVLIAGRWKLLPKC